MAGLVAFITIAVFLGFGVAKGFSRLRFSNWNLSMKMGWAGVALSIGLYVVVAFSSGMVNSDVNWDHARANFYRYCAIGLIGQFVVGLTVALVQRIKFTARFGDGFLSGLCDATVLLFLLFIAAGDWELALCLLAGWLFGQASVLVSKTNNLHSTISVD